MEEEPSASINPSERSYVASNESTPLQKDKVQDSGLKYIVSTFSLVTVIITVALGVSISQHTKEIGLRSSVVSDEDICSNIGQNLFKLGGNAIDIAVAVTICLGVVLPHLTGIGGNGLILVYSQKDEKPLLCLDSWSPQGNVPKLLLALHSAHSNYGKLPWKILIEPSVRIARSGYIVTKSLSRSQDHIKEGSSESLKTWLTSLKLGQNVTNPALGDSLNVIKEEGPDALYKGSLSSDLKRFLGISSIEDLKLNEEHCLVTLIEGFHIITSGQGSGGPLLHEALNNSNIRSNPSINTFINYFEGKDEKNWSLSSGVTVSASDDQDIYVSVVSGLGPVLGSQNMSKNGYIFGSSLPLPKSSSLSSTGAAFVASEASSRCQKRIIIGGVDVRDLVQVVPGLLWGSNDIETTVEAARVRITANGPLAEADHTPPLPLQLPPAPSPYPVINVLGKYADDLFPYPDSRGRL